MRELVPDELELDLYDNAAWIALVPFRMEATRFKGIPDLPGLGAFYECNVRTYVRTPDADGHMVPGVWFFSLDAGRLLPVLGGQWLWSLNYIHSRFTVENDAEKTRFDYALARRRDNRQRTHIRWTRGQALPQSTPGSIEHFLTERYWLFTVHGGIRGGHVMGGRVEHKPWSLRSANVELIDDTLLPHAGITTSGQPLAWHSDSIDVAGWNLLRMDRAHIGENAS